MSADAWSFRAAPGGADTGGYVVALHPAEREVLIALVSEVAALLGVDDVEKAAESDARPFEASGWSSDPVGAPDDPALRRLLPDAYSDDPQQAAEFRRLTEGDLRATKAARLRAVVAVLGHDDGPAPTDSDGPAPDDAVEVRVPAELASEVVAALTDLRLVMAERIGVQTAADADALVELVTHPWEQDATEPERVGTRLRATLYLMLGVLQDTLLEAMAGSEGSPRLGSPP